MWDHADKGFLGSSKARVSCHYSRLAGNYDLIIKSTPGLIGERRNFMAEGKVIGFAAV